MRGNAARAVVPALVVLGLLGIVAIAATGSTSSGTAETRPPADIVLDTIVILGMIMLVPGAALFLYALTQRDAIAREMATNRFKRMRNFQIFLFLMLLVVVFLYLRFTNWEFSTFESELGDRAFPGTGEPDRVTPTGGEIPAQRENELSVLPLLVILGLAAVATAAYLLSRRRAAPERADDVAAQLADAMDEGLDALHAESDPRKAVIAAYARLERVLAANGFAREDSETPNEYLARILADFEIDRTSVRRLTDLFTEAKFSHHAVDAEMKGEAIGALTTARDELRSRREAEQAGRTASPAIEAGAEGGKA